MTENLNKNLKLLDVFCISSGAMISSGIFILPGLAYSNTGPLVFVSYLAAGLLAFVGVLSVIELSTAMPKAGGDYYFINRSLGALAGTIAGLFSWAAIALKSAFAIFGLAEIIFIATGFPLMISAIILTVIFSAINIFGVKEAAKFEVTLVVVLIGLLILFIISGVFKFNVNHFSPILPNGFNSIFITSGFVFVSFGGLISVASVSEEIINPKRNIPLGIILSITVVTILYTLVLFVTVGVLPGEKLGSTLTPIADTFRVVAGTPGYVVISIAAVLAFITTAIAGIMSSARYPFALSKDLLIPKFFQKLSASKGTPVAAIAFTGLFIILVLFLKLEILVKAASTVVLTSNLFANIAIIILRESKVSNYRPSFRVPFYPWVQIISIILFGFFIIEMGLATVEISLGFLAFAVMVYFLIGRKKQKKESALTHLVSRIANRQLATSSLEQELREILIQRDEILHDEIDSAIKDASCFDFDESMDKNTLFKHMSNYLSQVLHFKENQIYGLFIEREEQGSTAISPDVAVPHIIIENEGAFEIVLVRSNKGIDFDENAKDVKAVFVIIGSMDRRETHLKALAVIAKEVSKPGFIANWQKAKNHYQLKDMFLLSDRART